jgi:hypothetical protein
LTTSAELRPKEVDHHILGSSDWLVGGVASPPTRHTLREVMSSRQPDLFQDDVQTDLFGEDSPTPVYRADPDAVRQELYKLLAEARAAQAMPWDAKRTTLYRTIFPQMTNWLPAEEGAQLRFEFETELARLEAA